MMGLLVNWSLLSYVLFSVIVLFMKHSLKTTHIIFINLFLLLTAIFFYSFLLGEVAISLTSIEVILQSLNISLTDLDLLLSYEFTSLTVSFSYLVLLIGAGANLYTLNYFKNEADEKKLVILLNLFIISMLTLVLAANFFTIFLGWELMGLTSFLLMNFWNLKISVLKSAMKAFTFNLASDLLLLGALVCFYIDSGLTDCKSFITWAESTYQGPGDLSVISSYTSLGAYFLILCGSMKSVQILAHIWLPDSMEAPVPASALIHSATLVSAGIFLVCRFNPIIGYCGLTTLMAFMGALTSAYGGVVAAQQTDMKKLLAYSTMSHCGFMWFLAGYGFFYITLVYLFLHGVFKATTFFCSGSFMSTNNSQDMRWMGMGSILLPVDALLLMVCSANLAGLPFTIGFFYKYLFSTMLFTTMSGSFTIALLVMGLLSSVVYFYKMTKYALFFFNSGVSQNFLSILLSSKLVLNSRLSLVNVNTLLAMLLVLTGGIVWFAVVWTMLHAPFSTSLDITTSSILVCNYAILGTPNMLLTFYALYLVVVLWLVLANFKKSYTRIDSLAMVLFFLLSAFLLSCPIV